MSARETLGTRLRTLIEAGDGDRVGLGLVGTLLERAEALPVPARERLLERATALLETYRSRPSPHAPAPRSAPDDTQWDEVFAARARGRTRRAPGAVAPSVVVAEIRAKAATARAADQVPESAGPYNSAVVAAHALEALVELAPAYVSGYIAWLEDLAALAELPARRPERKKPRKKG